MKFLISRYNTITKEGHVEEATKEQLLRDFLEYDIPIRINQSKTVVQRDTFSHALNIYTITRFN